MKTETKGLWLGLLGVAIFAVTLPMTRLAVGTESQPYLSGLFIAMGRAAVAGGLSLVFLWLVRAPTPKRGDWLPLAATAGGVVLGFPLFTSLAMRQVEAVHASVIVGVLPLATAMVGAWLHRQRPSLGFWVCAMLGSTLVIVFAVLRSGSVGIAIHPADALLLAAMACAAMGYGYGGRLAQRMPGAQVISWALVICLPLTLPLTLWSWPAHPVPAVAWGGFAYVAVFSMWLGFFAWYRGLALGGTVRVSQVQLVQPVLSMLVAMPLLGESVDLTSAGFGLAVVATVFIGRRMPVGAVHTHPNPPPAPPQPTINPYRTP